MFWLLKSCRQWHEQYRHKAHFKIYVLYFLWMGEITGDSCLDIISLAG